MTRKRIFNILADFMFLFGFGYIGMDMFLGFQQPKPFTEEYKVLIMDKDGKKAAYMTMDSTWVIIDAQGAIETLMERTKDRPCVDKNLIYLSL